MKALGINIYGGGFTLGVEKAGYEVVAQWEECNTGARTFDLNYPGMPHPLDYADWPVLDPRVENLDLIYANPPCAVWSMASPRTADVRMADPRLSYTARSIEMALALKPNSFICESVTQAYTNGGAFYDKYAQEFLKAGYGVTYLLTDALLHGLPSQRKRFHFIAHRDRLALKEPVDFQVQTVRNAIGDLHDRFDLLTDHVPSLRLPHRQMTFVNCPPGGYLRKELGRRWGVSARRLLWDAPAPTFYVDELVHPDRHRFLTRRELSRLGGYPDDFRSHAFNDLTRAVMPIMGQFVAEAARPTNIRADNELRVIDWISKTNPYGIGKVVKSMRETEEWQPDPEPLPRKLKVYPFKSGYALYGITTEGRRRLASVANVVDRRDAICYFAINWPDRNFSRIFGNPMQVEYL